MAEDFLEVLYREADAYTYLTNLVRDYRNGNSDSNFVFNVNRYIKFFSDLSHKMTDNGDIRGEQLWDSLVGLTKTDYLTECLDILEGEVLPKVYDYLKSCPRIDVDDEQGTILRSSETGFIYLINANTMQRCDSAINPMQEAYEIVKAYYNPEKYKYILLGGGLGYIPYQLYLQSEGEIEITVYFHDQKSYDYARLYGVLDWIPEENLHVEVSEDLLSFLYAAKDGLDDLYIYKPDMVKYPDNERSALNDIIISQNTKFTTNKFVTNNYYRNSRRIDKYIEDIDKSKLTDKFLVIAGGPSVDENIDFIRNAKEKGITTIAVGTVFKKLLKLGIRPDFVTACDPFVTVSYQFTDIEDNMGVPFLCGMETDYRAAKAYTGPKYFVPSRGISRQTYMMIKDSVKELLPSGTTVTSFSYGIAVFLGAKEIILVGADYGFPGGVTHASGTNDRTVVQEGLYEKVLSNDGTMIEANPQMMLYREEMEGLVRQYPEIKTYNLSKHGAKIAGTEMYSE